MREFEEHKFLIGISHVDFPMQIMAGLIRRGRQAGDVTAVLERAFAGVRRNDPCPCGSGRNFKQCHGRKAPCSKD